MENFSNEILIESVELNLLVTEGLVDKAKNVMAAVIKKIKEIVSKIKDFIMSKLKKDLKQLKYEASLISKDRDEYSCVVPNKASLDKFDKVYLDTYHLAEAILDKSDFDDSDEEKTVKLSKEADKVKQLPLTVKETIKGNEYANIMAGMLNLLEKKHSYLWSLADTFNSVANKIEKSGDRDRATEMKRCRLMGDLSGKLINYVVAMHKAYKMSLRSLLRAQGVKGIKEPEND